MTNERPRNTAQAERLADALRWGSQGIQLSDEAVASLKPLLITRTCYGRA